MLAFHRLAQLPTGVGKTSLLYRLCDETFVDYFRPCTIGIDFRVRTVDTRVGQLKLQVWDMQGERFVRFGNGGSFRPYYRGTVAVFLAYDITDRDSFDALGLWLEKARELAPDALLVVVGCKADLGDQRVVQADEVSALVAAEGLAGYVECSAKTGAGVESMFKAVAVAAHEKRPGRPWTAQMPLRALCVQRLGQAREVPLQRLPPHVRAEVEALGPRSERTVWQLVTNFFGFGA
eukprot:TRINITY_DN857_c0_g1_i10.p2 TRINITY_DN857_c0_g1~~TRINITY_DN857_c0_g1_i10.p2  ORF type:complete len:235 (+),score=44.62 TRINITY_DN857_c0_g1_i10:129-833(+)